MFITMDTIEAFILKVTAIPANYFIIGFVAAFYALEHILEPPFRFPNRNTHFFHNLIVQIAVYGAGLLFAIIQVSAIEWMSTNHIGLFHIIHVPFLIKLLIGVALFDLGTYWTHRLSHKIPVLWRIHRVHHSDTSMDSSTFFRTHPFEVVVFGTSQMIMAAVFGLDIIILGVYFLILIPFNVAQHSNIYFPRWVEKTFGLVFTTPNIHKVHHSKTQFFTDSNFADIFIIWDKLFGTYKYVSMKDIVYGLEDFEKENQQTFWYLLKSPFLKK
jgi:sterol desaturase/sphingolipid hydroxylase (fatty acid hydroxylase superfamily)